MTTKELQAYLASGQADEALAMLYGAQRIEAQRTRYASIVCWHAQLFGEKDRLYCCSAPGRTEVVGNHTDHQRGRVLAAAVHLDTIAAVSPNDEGIVRLYSQGYSEPFVVSLDDLTVHEDELETTHSLIRGVAARLTALGKPIGGFDAAVTSDVFKGSGLSSSAAFEVMLCEVFDALYGGHTLDRQERGRISQYAENVYFGKPSGLMDQMASSVGGLVAMDFKETPAQIEAIAYDFEAKDYRLVVVCAGGDHGNLTDQYAAIPQEMRQVAEALGGEVLRDVAPAHMQQSIPALKGKVNDRAILRALHFYDEDERVVQMVQALKQDDLPAFLDGAVASGQSSWTLLQNLFVPGRDNQELVLAVELSRRMLQGKGAWRIHGGGFAGTILAFVPTALLDSYTARMNSVFGEHACTVLRVRPVGPYTIG